MSQPINGIRSGTRPGTRARGCPPVRSPRALETRTVGALRPALEGLGGTSHRRRWRCLSPSENPLPPLSDHPKPALGVPASLLPMSPQGPFIRIRPGQIVQAVGEVVCIGGVRHLCGRVVIPLLHNYNLGNDSPAEDEAWFRADQLLQRIFSRQSHRAVLRFEPGPPLGLTLTVFIPLTGNEALPHLEELLAKAFLG